MGNITIERDQRGNGPRACCNARRVRRISAADRCAGRDAASACGVKRAGALTLLVAFGLGILPAAADQRALSSPALSGLATNALVRAYKASGFGADNAAPLRLQSIVVTIYTTRSNFWVMFSGTTTMEIQNIFIEGRTGSVLWKAGDPGGEAYSHPVITEAFMLPGVVAGEIIAAYQPASKFGYKPFQTGAYYTIFQPWPGGTFIAFDRTQEPTSVSTSPAPTVPCLSSCAPAAGYAVPGYFVTVRNSRVTITPDVNL
jgi:hypothetical protein